LSNIPAKAGRPVLRDFVLRSAALLAPGGRVLAVAVAPLGALFRSWIAEAGLPLEYDEPAGDYALFMYGRAEPGAAEPAAGFPAGKPGEKPAAGAENFFLRRPAYFRGSGDYVMEDISYHIDAVHGAPGFDSPGGAVRVMAKLVSRLGRDKLRCRGGSILIHEPGQGHFPLWLRAFLGTEGPKRLVLGGRNVLALEASRDNLGRDTPGIVTIPSVDPGFSRDALLGGGKYRLIAAFPEWIPGTEGRNAYWEGMAELLEPGGTALAALPSSEASGFDRGKGRSFIRLGDLKRKGFRALAYRYEPERDPEAP
jgi:hypothetical protein